MIFIIIQHEVEGQYIYLFIYLLAYRLEERDHFAAADVEKSRVLKLNLKEYKDIFYSCGKSRVV